jgi:hypothetical protein
MLRRVIVRSAFREDEWEYPEGSVREALVNAYADIMLVGMLTSMMSHGR